MMIMIILISAALTRSTLPSGSSPHPRAAPPRRKGAPSPRHHLQHRLLRARPGTDIVSGGPCTALRYSQGAPTSPSTSTSAATSTARCQPELLCNLWYPVLTERMVLRTRRYEMCGTDQAYGARCAVQPEIKYKKPHSRYKMY
eukprot:3687037-Rhodomonas_salina.2